jgi:hypothetical protein
MVFLVFVFQNHILIDSSEYLVIALPPGWRDPSFCLTVYKNSSLIAGSKIICPLAAIALIPDFDNALSVNGTIWLSKISLRRSTLN